MGEALDIAAVTGAFARVLAAADRPTPEAWGVEREPSLRRLSREASSMEVSSEERRGLLREEAALVVDGLLAPVARGRGALDLAIGEALGALSQGDRVLRLGYSCVGDYARENLGIAGKTAQAMAQLSRELRERPLLREAVLRGEVSARRALAVLPLSRGEDEASWVERARAETVRALQAAVRAEAGEAEAEEDWEKICLPVGAESRPTVDEAMTLAGKILEAGAPRHQCLEAMAQEYLGENPDDGEDQAEGGEAGHGRAGFGEAEGREPAGGEATGGELAEAAGVGPAGAEPPEPVHPGAGHAGAATAAAAFGFGPPPDRGFLSWAVEDWLRETKEALEVETGRWEALGTLDPVVAPRAGEEASPRALDGKLRRLVEMRRRWDELLSHLGLLVKWLGLWREAGFASFDHYCVERLWMAPRTVEQRVWLERRSYHLPGLREALRAGRLSYEQARLVAGVAEAETLEDWVCRAEGMTCIALRRAIEGEEERQKTEERAEDVGSRC